MASDSAFQIQYRQEYVQAFEQHATLLRDTVTTEAVIKGQQAVFLVAGSGSATAVNRGTNGRIPARADSNTQNTCTLQEWHDLVRKTSFNIFASQGNQTSIMQMTSVAVLNRKIDNTITAVLDTASVTVGATGQIPNVSLVMNGLVKLQNAAVPWDNNITLLCQPSFLAYLMQAPEWASALYVDMRPFAGTNNANWRDKPSSWKWMNMLVIMHPNLAGRGTTAEHSYMYHKSAVGHAMDSEGLKTAVGYFEEQDYSYARATAFMNAVMLQSAGVVEVIHDGSAYA